MSELALKVFVILAAVVLIYLFLRSSVEKDRASARAAAERNAAKTNIVCPHCHTQGTVQSRTVARKLGLSGGKVVAAILTGGLSILIVGLSRIENADRMNCRKCLTEWYV